MKKPLVKIDLYVTGNLCCDRSVAREQRGEGPVNGAKGQLTGRRASNSGIICLGGLAVPDEYDISAATVIDGSLDVSCLHYSGYVLVGGAYVTREEGGCNGTC